MSLTVSPFRPQDRQEWDDFVLRHPHGSPFHLLAWKQSIEQTFGFRPMYLVARNEVVQGVLPLFLVENFLVGKALISSPFAVYGGILAETAEAQAALRDQVRRLGESLAVDYVELRNAHAEQCVGFAGVSRYVTFTQPVGPGEESLLEALPKKTRNMVRKALKNPFVTRRGPDSFQAFESLYARNLRRLGTPSFPRRHFAALLENFGERIDIREVLLDGQVVAASMNFFFRDQMHTYYAASDSRYNAQAPNTYMYFDHLRWAGQSGYRTFDFGRCKRGTGTFEFKRHWGGEMRELPYEVLLVKRKDLPNFSPLNPRFQTAIKVWQNLPLPLTRLLGPRLIRLFP